MKLKTSDSILLVVFVLLVITSFLIGGFTAKMQLQDEIDYAKDFCANSSLQMSNNYNSLHINTFGDDNFEYGLLNTE